MAAVAGPRGRGTAASLVVRVLREPLVHFLLIGAVLFSWYAWQTPPAAPGSGPEARRIVITEGRVRQLAQGFAATWRRPPTAGELRGLIDAFVKEEVFYREALRLGLDRDDTLVRRRMQQKMEFLIEPGDGALTADEDILQAHLEANRAFFRAPAQAAFRQVFISPGANGEARARRLLERLRAAPPESALSGPGDRTLLPRAVKLIPLDEIAHLFGSEFADALPALPRHQWGGPVRSVYGLHLVRITAWKDGADPALAEIRGRVEQHWRQQRRAAHLRGKYERLLASYEVVLPDGPRQARLR